MQWQDDAIIIGIHRLSETSLRLDLLTKTHGRCSGMVRGGASKSKKHLCDLGNMLHVTWRGRLAEQLGSLTMELIKQPAAACMHDPLKLAIINSSTQLLRQFLAEKHSEPALYQCYHHMLCHLHQPSMDAMRHYLYFETELLASVGFPLDTTTCVATGSQKHLTYLSPKSGRAVSQDAGRPYHDKLFALPAFLVDEACPAPWQDIHAALAITSHFLDHAAEEMLHKPLAHIRAPLLKLVEKAAAQPTLLGHNSQRQQPQQLQPA